MKDLQRTSLGISNDTYTIFFLIFFAIKAYVVVTHLQQIEAIQMGTHNVCFYTEIDKSTLAAI